MIYEFKVIKKCPATSIFVGDVGEVIEINLKISEYDAFMEKYKGIFERYIGTAPAVTFEGRTYAGGHGVETKQPEGFKEVLAKIGEAHPISPLADRYRKNKTAKEIKTKQVVDRHRKEGAKLRQDAIRRVRNKVNG